MKINNFFKTRGKKKIEKKGRRGVVLKRVGKK